MDKELTKRNQTTVTSTAAEQMLDSGRAYSPDVDIYGTQDELLFLIDLPGVEPGNVQIDIDEANTLTLRARSSESQKENVVVRQYEIGDFYRAFRIGDEYDKDNTKAELQNGLLELRIPRREETKPKRIAITA